MSFRYRDLIARVSPRWLQGEWGTRLMRGGIGLTFDSLAQAGTLAFKSGLILSTACLDEAAGAFGFERGLRRYAGDTLPGYRARVWKAWETYAKAGTAGAILGQLKAFGLAPEVEVWRNGSLAELAPQAASAFTLGGLTAAPTESVAPDGSTVVRFEESGAGAIEHTLYAYANAPASSDALCVEFDVRLVNRDWLRVTLTGDVDRSTDAFINLGTRAVSYAGDLAVASVRALSADWYRVRVGFQKLSDTTYYVQIATGIDSSSTTHTADASAAIELSDASVRFSTWPLEVYTPRQWTRGDVYHPATGDEWWSRLWVYADYGVHRGTLTAEQKEAIVSLVRKWKPGRWHCDGVVLGGDGPVVGTGLIVGSFVVGGSGEEVLTV